LVLKREGLELINGMVSEGKWKRRKVFAKQQLGDI
jgi:hypothetical protein